MVNYMNQNKEKIDFVMIWVDGNDPKWQKEKVKYNPNKNTDSRNIRYRDWENLKYWFRGVEKYAPWVNKIYFVTCGHYPDWLNKENPKLVCVKHEDYIPKEYLPTFSANPIEINLHRIKNLSEQFVFFNDDIFIIDKINPTYFFKKGKPCGIAVFQPVSGEDETFVSIKNNVNLIINRHFKKKNIVRNNFFKYFNFKYGKYSFSTLCCLPYARILGFYEAHNATSFLKSTYQKIWEKEFDILDNTSRNKFRNPRDVNQYLFENWQFCEGNFYPRKSKSKFLKVFDDVDYASNIIKKQKYPLICLNDTESSDSEFECAKKEIIEAFEQIFPEKSSFER